MAISKSLKILCRLDFPGETVRLWQGSGPYMDRDGNIWRCCVISESALDQIEAAINAEAFTLELALSGVDPQTVDLAWEDHEEGQVIGSLVQILIQPCDDNDQPVGDEEVVFTGTIDNLRFNEVVANDEIVADIIAEITNRFVLRTLTNGAVLSDVDQRARSAALNPEAEPDRFCERIPGLAEHTINWPAWN